MSRSDWKRVNEALVRCGELLLDLGYVKGWSRELRGMNEDKEGASIKTKVAKMVGDGAYD